MWWIGIALGGPPGAVSPMLAPADAPKKWSTYQAGAGLPPSPLACAPVIKDEVLLCLRVREGESLRWVTASDLSAWQTTFEALVTSLGDQMTASLSRVETIDVPPLGSYLRLVDGSGWAAALAIQPAALAARLGPDARIAFPAGTVAVAWRAGSGDLDKAMAVGVVELAEEQPGEVSRTVYRFDGEDLVPFAQATPSKEREGPAE